MATSNWDTASVSAMPKVFASMPAIGMVFRTYWKFSRLSGPGNGLVDKASDGGRKAVTNIQ
ncbi:hypothetical protein GCM10023346_02240 [Arthrobacter gyeryongensis]|uniref:Uncharacterized protein n=1 Tax=Arthrobacter gyeryongensis TaxID=1650592 RepID=A0ABP9RXX6_9MICC